MILLRLIPKVGVPPNKLYPQREGSNSHVIVGWLEMPPSLWMKPFPHHPLVLPILREFLVTIPYSITSHIPFCCWLHGKHCCAFSTDFIKRINKQISKPNIKTHPEFQALNLIVFLVNLRSVWCFPRVFLFFVPLMTLLQRRSEVTSPAPACSAACGALGCDIPTGGPEVLWINGASISEVLIRFRTKLD